MSNQLQRILFVAFSSLLMQACSDSDGDEPSGCGSDNDCKGDRICVKGECLDPDFNTGTDDSDGTMNTDPGDTGISGGTDSTSDYTVDSDSGQTQVGDGVTDAELEEACLADCEAMQLADCAQTFPTNDQCKATCLLLDSSLQGYCFREQRDFYLCKTAGGYTCINDRAMAHSSCLEEQTAITECRDGIICHNYCKSAVKESCTSDESSCFDECMLDREKMNSSCASDYDRLIYCRTNNLICEEGTPLSPECEDEVARVAWCLGVHVENCDGYCWAAQFLGCGSETCSSSCQLYISESNCGYEYRDYVSCVIDLSTLNMTCSDNKPTPTGSCITKEKEYQDCVLAAASQ